MLKDLEKAAAAFLLDHPMNHVQAEDAIRPELTGMRMLDAPIFAVASAADPLFQTLKEPDVVHPDTLLPTDWLPGAKSVISFFIPFSEPVRKANRESRELADEWLHARIEGQMMVDEVGAFVTRWLTERGHAAVYPAAHPDFHWIKPFSSIWSERHVAYIAGLGTFGLSKGLISKKGVAGRYGSIITSAELPVTEREYDNPFAYCTMCGKCAKNCPPKAIDPEKGVQFGKNHQLCSDFLDDNTRPPHGPNQRIRYGCGKCQVGVPCEMGIPKCRMHNA